MEIQPTALNPTGEQPGLTQAERAQARLNATEQLEWLERLILNTDFQRFMGIMRAGMEAARGKANDVDGHTAEQRLAHSDRALELQTALEWVPKSLVNVKATLRKLDDERPL